MEKKCPECGSEEIIKGKLAASNGCVFIAETETGFVKKSSLVSALACKKCGAVFGLKLSDKPVKLTD